MSGAQETPPDIDWGKWDQKNYPLPTGPDPGQSLFKLDQSNLQDYSQDETLDKLTIDNFQLEGMEVDQLNGL